MTKLEGLGVQKSVVGLVVPTGYSFNLDGTSIYLTLAALVVAQATDTPLSLGQQLTLLAVLLLTSKGAAGVTGSGFIVLAATLVVARWTDALDLRALRERLNARSGTKKESPEPSVELGSGLDE
jgi:Na+/H+-dicarboxylate symporter